MAKRKRTRAVVPTISLDLWRECRVSETRKAPTAARGLGELVSGEGAVSADGKMKTVAAQCSCQGENSNCFKCGGTGFYEKRLAAGVAGTPRSAPAWHSEVSFSNDARGGTYGIRENGRFESSPLEDDYDA